MKVNFEETPTRSDANFLGWSTDQSATAPEYDGSEEIIIDTNDIESDSVTFYAVWNENMQKTTLATGKSSYNTSSYNILSRNNDRNFIEVFKAKVKDQYDLPIPSESNKECIFMINFGGGTEGTWIGGLQMIFDNGEHYSLTECLRRGYIKNLYGNGSSGSYWDTIMKGDGSGSALSYKTLVYQFTPINHSIIGFYMWSTQALAAQYTDGVYIYQAKN